MSDEGAGSYFHRVPLESELAGGTHTNIRRRLVEVRQSVDGTGA